MSDDGANDLERDLRPLSDYAIVSVLGCAFFCVLLVILALIVAALVRWL